MKHISGKMLLLAAGAMALGGCSLFSPKQMADLTTKQKNARADAAGVSGIDQGRSHLRTGNWGSAIEAFNVALATGEDPAASYNGLGVAYAKLGRTDLAYRFFKKAAISNPNNPMFSRNLAMLMDSPGFDLAAMNRGEGQLAQAEPPAEREAPKQAAARLPEPGKLTRDAHGQFTLITANPATTPSVGPMPRVASRTVAPKTPVTKAAAAPKLEAEVDAVPAAKEERKPQRKTITIPAAVDEKVASAS